MWDVAELSGADLVHVGAVGFDPVAIEQRPFSAAGNRLHDNGAGVAAVRSG
jgi:hypothetical protein